MNADGRAAATEPVAPSVSAGRGAAELPCEDLARATGDRLTAWQHVAVILAFAALVSLFTYPLVRDPGGLLPRHKDPFMYGWTMVSNAHRLLSVPLAVFHGNTFYPYGNTIAFTDLLLTPTVTTAAPIYFLTGNPVLQYNLTLLIWWALSGWAMYVMTYGLLRSHAGATIAALAFALCPYRTDYFLEFEMQLAFPIPLALFFFFRFLETQRWRDLAWVVLLVWVEALAAMYYAIMLGFCLVVVATLHAILRSGAWNWTVIRRSVMGTLALSLFLAPFLVPYVQNYRELGLHRELAQPAHHSADILTYFETGVTKLYRFRPSGHIAETSLFMGFVALALAAGGVVLRGGPPPPGPGRLPLSRRVARLWTLALAGAAAGLAVTLIWGESLRAAGFRPPPPPRFFDALLLLGLARIGLAGWWAARAGDHRRPLGERELRWIFVFLLALFFVLSLGPTVHYGRTELGKGLYHYLYPYLFPLRAIRITTRFGVVVVLAVGFLAGLGMARLAARFPGARARAAVTALLALLLLVEYAPFPLRYQPIDWSARPPVYRVLAQDPEDVAVLEWPLGIEYWDDYYTFMSIGHWKRLVNGASGFLPPLTHDISGVLSEPDSPVTPFPSPAALRILRDIHPLRYVVVHNKRLHPREQKKWRRLKELPWARYVGRFGDDDLYQLTGDAIVDGATQKSFSWDYARGRREIHFRVRPLGRAPSWERWIEVDRNGRAVGRREIGEGWSAVVMPLGGPLYYSAPNTVTIRLRYHQPGGGPARPIGRTGSVSPVDLHVVSGGHEHGNRVSVLIDGVEAAPYRRGYHVVAIDPESGRVLSTGAFDTHAFADESRRLADAIWRLPRGIIVVAAVRDEASAALTEEAVAALRSVGGATDIRGHYGLSHLLVGSKGAAPGTALERSGYRLLVETVGLPPDENQMEVRDFALR